MYIKIEAEKIIRISERYINNSEADDVNLKFFRNLCDMAYSVINTPYPYVLINEKEYGLIWGLI